MHTIVSLTSTEAANKVISKGLYINMEHLKPHKDKREPIRCLKCQHWGHIARDCKGSTDTHVPRATACPPADPTKSFTVSHVRLTTMPAQTDIAQNISSARKVSMPECLKTQCPTSQQKKPALKPLYPPHQTAQIVKTRQPISHPLTPKQLMQTKLPFTPQAPSTSQENNVDADTTYHSVTTEAPPSPTKPVPLNFPCLSPLLVSRPTETTPKSITI